MTQIIAPVRSNLWAIVALIVGILSVITSFIPVLGMVAFPAGAGAIVFGIIGLVVKRGKRGQSIAGIVLGAVAIVIAVIVTAITAMFVGAVSSGVNAADTALNAPHVAEYSVSSTADASVSYTGAGTTASENFTGAWTKKENFKGFDLPTISVIDMTGAGQKLTCEIKIDGKSVVKQQGTSTVSCSAPTK